MTRAAAIIVAGGSGKRMGRDVPKQYLLLDGVPILVHTLRKFEKASKINHIILVVPKNDIDYVKHEIVEKYNIIKVEHTVAGGKKRQDSVMNGLRVVNNNCEVIAIHDAVRPFIEEGLVNLSVTKALEEGAVTLGVPAKDTVKSVNTKGFVKQTHERRDIWLTQTPQSFRKDIIENAFKKAYRDGFYGTDDASLVERSGEKVKMIEGTYENIKITTPEDIFLGEFILHKKG